MTRAALIRLIRNICVVISASVLGVIGAFLLAVTGIASGNLSFFSIPVLASIFTLLLNRGIPKHGPVQNSGGEPTSLP